MTYSIYQGATRPKLTAQIVDASGNAVALTGATVKINVGYLAGGDRIVTLGAVTITDAANGLVEFAFSAAQTAISNAYRGQFWITWADLSTQATEPFDVVIGPVI